MPTAVKLFIGNKRQVVVCHNGDQFCRKWVNDPRYGVCLTKWKKIDDHINDLAPRCWFIDEVIYDVPETTVIKKYQKYWKDGRLMVRPD